MINHPWCVDSRSRDSLLHQGHPPSSFLTPQFGGSSLLAPGLLLRLLAQLGRPAHFPLLNFPNPLFSTGDSIQTLIPPYAFSDFPACPLYKMTTPLPSSCSTSLLGPSASLSLFCHFRPSSDLSYHFAQVWGCVCCVSGQRQARGHAPSRRSLFASEMRTAVVTFFTWVLLKSSYRSDRPCSAQSCVLTLQSPRLRAEGRHGSSVTAPRLS